MFLLISTPLMDMGMLLLNKLSFTVMCMSTNMLIGLVCLLLFIPTLNPLQQDSKVQKTNKIHALLLGAYLQLQTFDLFTCIRGSRGYTIYALLVDHLHV